MQLAFRLDAFIWDSHTEVNDSSTITTVNAWICYKCMDDSVKVEVLSSEMENPKTKLRQLLRTSQACDT